MSRLRSLVRAASVVLAAGALFDAAWAGASFVRINQLGFEAGLPARAYVMVDAPQAPTGFKVLDRNGRVVLNAPVGASSGTWGGFKVYPLNFQLDDDGWYSIAVSGAHPASSAAFPVASAARLYAAALKNSLIFFEEQRDGRDYIASGLRHAPAHLNDKRVQAYKAPVFTTDDSDLIVGALVPTGAVLDVEGGWFDAGDYVKFVQTHSYTVAMLLTGIRDFPDQMGHGSANADFVAEAKFGLRWLLKMWDDKSRTLYHQVGIGTGFVDEPSVVSDHDIWRLPQVDDTLEGNNPDYRYIRHRPVFAAGPAGSKISPNLAGRMTASFALCYRVFKWEDSGLARQCLLAAQHIYELADTRATTLVTAEPASFYPEVEWRDDLEWGATELYLAMSDTDCALPDGLTHRDPEHYLRQAAKWAKAYIGGPNDAADTLNLYDVSGLAHFDLHRAIDRAGRPQGLDVSQADLLADMRKQLDGAAAVGSTDPFGYGFTWGAWDSAAHGIGLSILAKQYYALTGDGHWAGESRRWLGNGMGANAWGLSMIVGDGDTFPNCLQHQIANIVGGLNGRGTLLRGAVVEGSNSPDNVATDTVDGMKQCPVNGVDVYAPFNGNGAAFWDATVNYPNTEAAIDLSAASPLMFAWRIAGRPDRRVVGF